MTHRLRIRFRSGGFVPLTRTQGIHMPAAPFDGVTFISLADARDVRVLHGYDRTADIIR